MTVITLCEEAIKLYWRCNELQDQATDAKAITAAREAYLNHLATCNKCKVER